MTWRKQGSAQTPNTKKNYFWVTCQHCGQKLAIPPQWVFKYLERTQGYEHEGQSRRLPT